LCYISNAGYLVQVVGSGVAAGGVFDNLLFSQALLYHYLMSVYVIYSSAGDGGRIFLRLRAGLVTFRYLDV
jgi:hypothetical protein